MKYQGKVTIVDSRLMGRFGSNIEHIVGTSRSKWFMVLRTKMKAMYYDYCVYGSNKGIYYSVQKTKD